MKNRILLILIVCFVFTPLAVISQTQNKSKPEIKIDSFSSEKLKTLYAMGVMLGENLKRIKPSPEEIKAVESGLKDAAENSESKVDVAKYHEKIQSLYASRIEQFVTPEKNRGRIYQEQFKQEEGVIRRESGLLYKIDKEGIGDTPRVQDSVIVHYHGTLIDGSVFDSSIEKNQKIRFLLSETIEGFKEGLQTMKVGGKSTFVIPSNLGFGNQGADPAVPGGATLIFTVELFEIIRNEE